MDLFRTLIQEPIYNALIFLYNILGDMGLAIIALTILVRILLVPVANKALRAQRRLQLLQPELQKIQKKHKDDRERLAKEMMAFYKKEGVNPASSCLPTLVQIPILIALFFVFKDAVTGHELPLYSFVSDPGNIDTKFLGFLDLAKADRLVLPLIVAVLQYVQAKMMMPKGADLPAINKQLLYLFPVITFVVSASLPAALPLYYATFTLFLILQQQIIMRTMPVPEAKAEAVADWNEANPADTIDVKATSKKAKRSGGAQVTVRKRTK